MSALMHYIWKNNLLDRNRLQTTAGKKIEIVSAGIQNSVYHNIFTNACLKIDGTEFIGNVILHDKSSHWEKEIKENAIHNERIILHVTQDDDVENISKTGETIHRLKIALPKKLEKEYDDICAGKRRLQCDETIQKTSGIKQHAFLSRLLIERIENKAERITRLYEESNKRWNDTLFKLLARNFGFGIQSDTFETWARNLDMQALGKHRDNALQTEAIFFGQAGLLNLHTRPHCYRAEAEKSEYYNNLLREYKFLSSKFNLNEIDGNMWHSGNATPHVRIARLATLYRQGHIDIATISECNTTAELRNLLQIQPDGYWRFHLQFGGTETHGVQPLKKSQTDLLIINTVVPILYAYGKHRRDDTLCAKAEDFLHTLQSEENSIIRNWRTKGIDIESAADSQALIQLRKEYCDKSNCKNCHFAFEYFKEQIG